MNQTKQILSNKTFSQPKNETFNLSGVTVIDNTLSLSNNDMVFNEVDFISTSIFGNGMTTYGALSGDFLPDNEVSTLVEDSSLTTLWHSTVGGGLWKADLQNLTATTYNATSGNYSGNTLPNNINYMSIYNDILYIGSSLNGFYTFDTIGLVSTLYDATSGNYSGTTLPASAVRKTYGDITNDNIWFVTTSSGFIRYNVTTNTVARFTSTSGNYSGDLLNNNARDVKFHNNFIWFATTGGIFKFDPVSSGMTAITTTSGNYTGDLLPNNSIATLIPYSTNELWVIFTSTGGLWRLNTDTNVATRFSNTSNNYSGDILPTSSLQAGALFRSNHDSIYVPISITPRSFLKFNLLTLSSVINSDILNSNQSLSLGIFGFLYNDDLNNNLGDGNIVLGKITASNGLSILNELGGVVYNYDKYGLKTLIDYSDFAHPRLVADQSYVDTKVNASIVTASNGLTKINNDIKLGGNITSNSLFNLGGYDLNFRYTGGSSQHNVKLGSGSFDVLYTGTTSFSRINIIENTLTLLSNNTLEFTVYTGMTNTVSSILTMGQNLIDIKANNIEVSSFSLNFSGIEYGGNYAANYTNRSLVDKEYVLSLTSPTTKLSYTITGTTGGTTTFPITHSKNTRDVIVQVYEVGSPYGTVIVDVERTTVNTINVNFAVAPSSGVQYKVVII